MDSHQRVFSSFLFTIPFIIFSIIITFTSDEDVYQTSKSVGLRILIGLCKPILFYLFKKLFFKIFFMIKYIKIIFYFLKIIFKINTLKQFKI